MGGAPRFTFFLVRIIEGSPAGIPAAEVLGAAVVATGGGALLAAAVGLLLTGAAGLTLAGDAGFALAEGFAAPAAGFVPADDFMAADLGAAPLDAATRTTPAVRAPLPAAGALGGAFAFAAGAFALPPAPTFVPFAFAMDLSESGAPRGPRAKQVSCRDE